MQAFQHRERSNKSTYVPALSEVTAGRSFLASLDGSCRTPVAASAVLCPTGHLTLDGMILSLMAALRIGNKFQVKGCDEARRSPRC